MFSFEEKLAAIRVAMDIARSDGKLDPQEVGYTAQLFDLFNFASSAEVMQFAREEAHEITADEAIDTLGKMSPKNKTLIAEMMAEMVFIDGEVHDNEREIMRAVLMAMFSA